MNKINKIGLDRIKQGCFCVIFEGHKYKWKAEECKACLHRKGLSFVKKHNIKFLKPDIL